MRKHGRVDQIGVPTPDDGGKRGPKRVVQRRKSKKKKKKLSPKAVSRVTVNKVR